MTTLSTISGEIDSAVDTAVADLGKEPQTPAASAPAVPSGDGAPASSVAAASVPAAPATSSEQPAAATAPPETPALTPTVPEGQPSPEKWPQILDNARKKESERVTTELFARFGLDQSDDPARARDYWRQLRTDPIGLYRRLGEELRPYLPEFQTPKPQAAPVAKPQPRFLDPTSNTPLYAADQVDQMLQQLRDELRQQMTTTVEPLEAEVLATVRERMWGDAVRQADEGLTEARSWHGFKELSGKIAELMERDGRVTLESAYNRLYQPWRKEHEAISKAAVRGEVLAELNKAPKAPDPDGLRPGAPRPAAAAKAKRGKTLDSDIDAALDSARSKLGV